MPSTWKPRRAVFALALAGLAVAAPTAPARGDTLDLSLPRAVVVGAPRGAAPSERIDPARTGGARTRLPSSPVELWRRHVDGNIDVSPLVDASDNVIVALTIPEIIKEMLATKFSERQGRLIDHDEDASMENKKREGYF